jgi:hypothetical protein
VIKRVDLGLPTGIIIAAVCPHKEACGLDFETMYIEKLYFENASG